MKKAEYQSPRDTEGRRAIGRLALYVLLTVAVSCIALLFNVGLIYALYTGVAQFAINEAYSKRIGQLVLLVGPFLLLFPEWMFYDMLVAPFRQKR
jgi:hypothetical protein